MHLRFSIRDLLWLTLVVAALTAWWVDRHRLTQLADDAAGRESQAKMQQMILQNELTTLARSREMQLLIMDHPPPETDPPLDNMPIVPPPKKIQSMPNAVQPQR
jgi:hypothetical protein